MLNALKRMKTNDNVLDQVIDKRMYFKYLMNQNEEDKEQGPKKH